MTIVISHTCLPPVEQRHTENIEQKINNRMRGLKIARGYLLILWARRDRLIMEILCGAKNGFNTLGCNYAESEPTWMKSAAL